jgi:hypothetical protein
MPIQPTSKRQADAFRRFMLLLPREKDPVLVVLKGHLLIEEQLRLVVDARVAKPDAVAKAQLECFQVICLVEALCLNEAPLFVWDALRKLNKLRNDLAHKLEPKGVHDRMIDITTFVEENCGISEAERGKPDSDLFMNFEFAIWLLFTQVASLVEGPPSPKQPGPIAVSQPAL